MAPQSALNRGIVLRFMRETLSQMTEPGPRVHELMDKVLLKLISAGFVDQSQKPYNSLGMRNPVVIALAEGYYQLVSMGYIVPQSNTQKGGGPDWDWFDITEIGRVWASGSEPVPEDPEGYMGAFRASVHEADPVIVQYVDESLRTYQHHSFFASAVMLGAASEKLVYLLMEAIERSTQDPQDKATIRNAIKDRGLTTMFKLILESIRKTKTSRPGKTSMPYGIHENAENHLLSLQDGIRIQRNDAVHPQTNQVNPLTVRVSISSFLFACRKVYDLIGWFNANQF